MQKILQKITSLFLVATISTQLFSCGYLIHPERRGQKSTSSLDWPIVGLDAIGLLFFIIPGVIAFAIDFTSGTIYLPGGSRASLENLQQAKQLKFDPKTSDAKSIAAAIQNETGVKLSFNDSRLIKY